VKDTVRTHVLLARPLVDAIDRLVGERRRGRFVADAVEEKLARVRQRESPRRATGALDPADYPYWSTP
jgi:hypothetical protein